jgi:hypothetical protein
MQISQSLPSIFGIRPRGRIPIPYSLKRSICPIYDPELSASGSTADQDRQLCWALRTSRPCIVGLTCTHFRTDAGRQREDASGDSSRHQGDLHSVLRPHFRLRATS